MDKTISSKLSQRDLNAVNYEHHLLVQSDYYPSDSDTVLEVLENERYDVKTSTWDVSNLISSDPKRFQCSSGQFDTFPTPPLPADFLYSAEWEVDLQVLHNEGGWVYGVNFTELDLHHMMERSARTPVRRRRWIRRIERVRVVEDELVERLTRSSIASKTATDSPVSKSPASESFIARALGAAPYSPPRSLVGKEDDKLSDFASMSADDDCVLDCDVEFEDDSSRETDSVSGDTPSGSGYAAYVSAAAAAVAAGSEAVSAPPSVPASPLGSQPAPAKKRNSFFSLFTAAPAAASPSAPGSTASTPPIASSSNPAYVTDPVFKVQSTTLSAIGKQIRFLEGESKKAEEARKKEWRENEKPKQEAEISALEKKAAALKARLEKEASRGGEGIAALDEELRLMSEQLDVLKRRLYFPTSPITVGQAGVYLALTDFWLEKASGSFFLEISTEKSIPVIIVHLMGTQDNVDAGVSARLKLEGFKLAGDKGSGVPKLSFENLSVTVAFSVQMRLHYDVKLAKWCLPRSDFKLKIVSFKGPYGLNGSIVSLVVSLLTPTIRSQLLGVIPFELGLLVRTLPCPTVVRGQFHLNGVELSMLAAEWHKSSTLAKMCRLSQQQMEMFYWLQKSLDRSPTMKSMQDFIPYLRAHRADGPIWRQLEHLWSQATSLYCEKVQTIKLQEVAQQQMRGGSCGAWDPAAYSIAFETFVTVSDELLHKRISTHFKLQHVESQLSVHHLMSFIFQIVERVVQESIDKSTNDLQRVRLMSLGDRVRANYLDAREILKMVGKNLDFAQLGITACVHSGPDGYLEAGVTEILAQAPLLLQFNFSKEKNIGALPLVPYILSVKPQVNGDIMVEVYHFTHDSNDVPSVLQDSETGSQRSHRDSPALGADEDAYTSQNIRTGCYSTSYNRVVSSIASLKAMGGPESGGGGGGGGGGPGGLVLRRGHGCDLAALGPGVLRRQASRGVRADQEHLFVREEELKRSLEEILSDHPIGRQADTVLGVTTRSPHISFIVDKAVTLKPGAELFTLLLGPQKEDWKPFGTPNMFAEDEAAEAQRAGGGEGFIPEYEKAKHDHPTLASKEKPGCPIMVQTSPGIKLLVQVPSVSVNMALPSLVRFFLAHFVDLQLLKAYLESLLGGEFFEEQLVVIKVIVEKMAKYLLVPGLDIEINLNGKIVTMNSEIMVRIDTPNEEGLSAKSAGDLCSCAIEMKAQLSLKQLLEDSLEIEAFLHRSTASAATTSVPAGSATASRAV